MDYTLFSLITGHQHCAFGAVEFQTLNVLSAALYLLVAYVLLREKGSSWFVDLIFIAGMGSVMYHAYPNTFTEIIDVLPAVATSFAAVYLLTKLFKNKKVKNQKLYPILGMLLVSIGLFLADYFPYVCTLAPSGVHFLWHISSAYVLYSIGSIYVGKIR